jgi:O-antigen ligase
MTTAEPAAPSAPIDPSERASEGTERTPWLLRFLCFLIPVLPSVVILPGALKGNGSPARMIALMMFGLVVLGFAMVRRTAPARHVNPGAVILLIYFLLLLTTYGVGLLHYDSFVIATSRTRTLIALIAHVGVALYVLARIRTARQRDIVLGWLAAGLTFACLVGFLQGVSSINLRFLFDPPGFVLNAEDLGFGGLSERLGVRRVQGTSQHSIEFSVLAAATVPLTIYFARNAATRHVRLLSGAACGLALLALPASISRSGLISLIVALLVYMLAFKVRPIAIAVAAGSLAIGGYIVAFPRVANALWTTITGSAEDASVHSRLEDYAKVSEAVRDHPIFGLGLGGAVPTVYGYLDNQWMGAIEQGGLVGLTAMIVLSGGAIFGIAAALRSATSPREREQAYMLGAMGTGILASSTTFDLFGFEQVASIFFIVFALLWSAFTIPAPEPHKHLTDRISSVPAPQHHRLDRLLSSRSHATLLCAARRRAASAMPM